jgi:uncharacterized protein YbjT (DUF2867 family)
MKIVVVGGTGFIGSKLVRNLGQEDHDAVAASPDTGVDTITGQGLADALAGTSVVVDVSNAPPLQPDVAREFFETSTRNLLAAEGDAGVRHHVVLSIVGADRLAANGYFQGKLAQEKLSATSSIPCTIVRATQFFEFVKGIADAATDGDTVHLPPARFQPMAADRVAAVLGEVAIGAPADGTIEIAGPEPFRMDDLARRHLAAIGDRRTVVADPEARYFGVRLEDDTLLPGDGAELAATRYDDWFALQADARR